MPDHSLLDSPISARDFKYIRDSYFSQNHPNIMREDLTLDQGSFARGGLDSAARKRADYLVALLDADRSMQVQQQAGRQIGRPQDASSPKHASIKDAHHIRTTIPQDDPYSLGSISQRTPSFQKHSMRAADLQSPSIAQSLQSLRTRLAESTAKQSNYQPAQVQEIDNSHRHLHSSQQTASSARPLSQEITPSPLRHVSQQQFWTAKQTWDGPGKHPLAHEEDGPSMPMPHAESMVAALGVLSPIRRGSLQPDWATLSQQPLSPIESVRESAGSPHVWPLSPASREATVLQAVRSDDEDCHSVLSKVDATSLQQAISRALTTVPTVVTPGHSVAAPSQSLGASIAARFRASRGSFHDLAGQPPHVSPGQLQASAQAQVPVPTLSANLLDLNTPAKASPQQDRVASLGLHVLEPIKHGSPLQDTASRRSETPRLQRQDSNKENATPPPASASFEACEKNQADVTGHASATGMFSTDEVRSLVERLEQVEQECSRRGLIIDTLVHAQPHNPVHDGDAQQPHGHDAETPVEDARAAVDAARAFELEQAKQQMSEMKAAMQGLMQQQQHQWQEAERSTRLRDAQQEVECTARAEEASWHAASLQQVANTLATAPPPVPNSATPRGHAQTPAQAQAQHLSAFAGEESIAEKMQRWDQSLLADTAGSMSSPHLHHVERMQTPSFVRDYRQRAAAYASPMSAQKSATRPQTRDQSLRMPLSPLSAESPIRAELTPSPAPSGVSMTKPLLARHMPDWHAHDSKLYNDLALAEVDGMDVHARGNLIKNIAIQLGVPVHGLSATVCALGSEAGQQEVLVHETIKLRLFAEQVHARLYQGARMAGTVADAACLDKMQARVGQISEAVQLMALQQQKR